MSHPPPAARLILASTSPYRRELLARLRMPFEVFAPDIDESPRHGEAPAGLALRLACGKAETARQPYPDSLIVGSDQVAMVGDLRLDKPGSRAAAITQLSSMQGRPVSFSTAVCVLNSRTGTCRSALVPVTVWMRNLSRAQIERYVDAEVPFDCAGSARIEGLGIALVERIEADDPTALIGLPLIKLCALLRDEGVELP